jgi:hypothetical protein
MRRSWWERRLYVRIIHQDNDFDVIAAMTTLVATSG